MIITYNHICSYFSVCFLLYLDISLSNVQNFIEECIITSKLDHPNVIITYNHICSYFSVCFLLYLDISLSNVQNFIEECIITSKLDYPNVLSVIGVSINPVDATLHMVMLFMDHGDVKSFLKSKRGDEIEFDNFPEVLA